MFRQMQARLHCSTTQRSKSEQRAKQVVTFHPASIVVFFSMVPVVSVASVHVWTVVWTVVPAIVWNHDATAEERRCCNE